MPMTPPTRVLFTAPTVGYNATASPKTTPTLDVVAGDLIVVKAATENNATTLNPPTASGGSVTWTQQQVASFSQYCNAYVWTGVVGATATGITVSIAKIAGSLRWGFEATLYRGHGGVGVTGQSHTTGMPSLALTTGSDNSTVEVLTADWNALDGTSRAYRTINGSPMVETTYMFSDAHYTVYSAYTTDAGTSGVKTLGMTAPDGQKYAAVGVEVLGTTNAAYSGIAALAGAGQLSAAVTPKATGVAALTGAGQLSTSSIFTGAAAVVFAGSGSLTATGVPARPGAASLTGSGALTTAGLQASSGAAGFTGTGTLSAATITRMAAAAGFTGSGSLTSTSTPPGTAGVAAFTGGGSLRATPPGLGGPIGIPLAVGYDNADGGASSTGFFTLPTITRNGYLVFGVGNNLSAANIESGVEGFDQLSTAIVDGATSANLYGRPVTPADSGLTVTVNMTTGSRLILFGAVIPGGTSVETIVPWTESTPDSSIDFPAMTPLTANALDLTLIYFRTNTTFGTIAPPSGFTELLDRETQQATGPWFGGYAAYRQMTGQAGVTQGVASAAPSTPARNIGWRLSVAAGATTSFSGVASFSGSGSLVGTGSLRPSQAAGFTGAGTLATTGVIARGSGVAGFTGAGALNGTGVTGGLGLPRVTRSGPSLQINGTTARLSGHNLYWLVLNDNARDGSGAATFPTQQAITDTFSALTAMSGNLARVHTLGISVGNPEGRSTPRTLMPTLDTFNEFAFVQADKVVAAAAAAGVYLWVPTTDRWNFYHGGGLTLAKMVLGSSATITDFFTNRSVIDAHKRYLTAILNRVNTITGIRYGDDPTLAFWETGNEIYDAPRAWTVEIAAHLRSLAPNALIGDGSGASGKHVSESNVALTDTNIDFVSGHFYDDHRMDTAWMTADAAAARAAGKVYMVGEYDWTDTSNNGSVVPGATPGQPKVLMGMNCRSNDNGTDGPDWAGGIATVGQQYVSSCRIYGTADDATGANAERLSSVSNLVLQRWNAGVTPVVSLNYTSTALTKAGVIADANALAAQGVTRFFLVFDHEPFNNMPGNTKGLYEFTAAQWVASQMVLLDIAAQCPNVVPTFIMNGYAFYGDNAYKNNTPQAYLTPALMQAWAANPTATAAIDAYTADGFLGGDPSQKGPADSLTYFANWCATNYGLTRLGVGEMGAWDPGRMTTGLQAAVDLRVQFCCWWNHRQIGCELVNATNNNKLTIFRQMSTAGNATAAGAPAVSRAAWLQAIETNPDVSASVPWALLVSAAGVHRDKYEMYLPGENTEQTAGYAALKKHANMMSLTPKVLPFFRGFTGTDGTPPTSDYFFTAYSDGDSAQINGNALLLSLSGSPGYTDRIALVPRTIKMSDTVVSFDAAFSTPSAESYFRVSLRGQTGDDTIDYTNAYVAELNVTSRTWSVTRRINGVSSAVTGSNYVQPSLVAGTAYHYEFSLVAGVLQLRQWLASGGTRPAAATATWTGLNGIAAPGLTGITWGGGNAAPAQTASIDNVTVDSPSAAAFSATAALSGSGSLTTGTLVPRGTGVAAFTGVGSLATLRTAGAAGFTGSGSLTAAGQLTTSSFRTLWGTATITSQWDNYLAGIGPQFVKSRRMYRVVNSDGTGAQSLGNSVDTINQMAAQGILTVMSFKGTNTDFDWDQLVVDLGRVTGPCIIVVDHEPLNNKPGNSKGLYPFTSTQWLASQRRLMAIVNQFPLVTMAIIWNGFVWAGTNAYNNNGGDEYAPVSLTDDMIANNVIAGGDFYDGGSYDTTKVNNGAGQSPGDRVRTFTAWANGRGITRLGAGEVGTFYLPNMVDAMKAVNDSGFEWACWWNHSEDHENLDDLPGDEKRTVYRSGAVGNTATAQFSGDGSLTGGAVGGVAAGSIGFTDFNPGSATTSTPTINLPTIAQAGYVYLGIGINAGSANPLLTAPPGWDPISGPIYDSTAGSTGYLYGKTVTAADSGAPVSWAWTNPGRATGVAAYIPGSTGVDQIVSYVESVQDNSTETAAITPGINDAVDLVMFLPRTFTTPGSFTPPAGWIEGDDRTTSQTTGPYMGSYAAYRQMTGQAGLAQSAPVFACSSGTRTVGWRLTTNTGTPQAFLGTASLSGSGSLTTSARVPRGTGIAGFTGAGSLSGVGTARAAAAGIAGFTGAGSLTTTAATTPSGIATLTGSGSLTADTATAVAAVAALTGDGTLTAAGSTTPAGAAGFSGDGALTATGITRTTAPAAFTGSGALTTTSIAKSKGTAAFTGSGLLSASSLTLDLVTRRSLAELHIFTDWLTANGAHGIIRETGSMNQNDTANLGKWNALRTAYLRELNTLGVNSSTDGGGRNLTSADPSAVIYSSAASAGAAADVEAPNSGPLKYAQTAYPATYHALTITGPEDHAATPDNVGGALVDGTLYSNLNPGVHNVDYRFPVPADWDLLASMGMTEVRIPFAWERVQPAPGDSLDTVDVNLLRAAVEAAAARGINVVLVCANYGDYSYGFSPTTRTTYHLGNANATITHAHLADLWTRIHGVFGGYANVIGYDLMNSPRVRDNGGGFSDMAQAVANWKQCSQTVVTALRNAGSSEQIIVPGWGDTPTVYWTAVHGPTGWISDPAANTLYGAPQFFDVASTQPRSGTYSRAGGYSYASEEAIADQTFSGVATFTGSGVLATSSRVAGSGTVGFTGSGALTATAVAGKAGAAAFTGAGSLTSTVVPRGAGAASLTGDGTLTASSTVATAGAVGFTGAGSLSVAGAARGTGIVGFTGAGSLTAGAGIANATAAAFTGGGSLTAAGTTTPTGTAGFTGSGSLSSSNAGGGAGSASLSGSGALTTGASALGASGVAALSGAGSLSASGIGSGSGAGIAGFTGSGALTGAAAAAGTGSGTGTFTGAGALTAGGTATSAAAGLATLSGSGTLTAGVGLAIAQPAGFTGSGSLTATTPQNFTAVAEFTGAGTLTAATLPGGRSAAALSGSGTLTASGISTPAGAPTFTGSGSLTGSGTATNTAAGTAALTGSGSLTSTGAGLQTGGGEFRGTGTLTASGVGVSTQSGQFSGDGTLTTSGRAVSGSGAVGFTGSGALTAVGAPGGSAVVGFTGSGTLAAAGVAGYGGLAAFTGSGSLNATLTGAALDYPAFTGSGSLSAGGATAVASTAGFTGAGTLTASSTATNAGTAGFTGSGTLSVTSRAGGAGVAALSGDGTLTGSGTTRPVGAAAFTGDGVLSATGVPTQTAAGTAGFTGSGTLTISGTITGVGGFLASFTGSGALTAAPATSGSSGGGDFTGAGTLTAGVKAGAGGVAYLTGSGVLTTVGALGGTHAGQFSGSGVLSGSGLSNPAGIAAFTGSGSLRLGEPIIRAPHRRRLIPVHHPRTLTSVERATQRRTLTTLTP